MLLIQFGSTVTGRTHPGSDLDLAVLLERVPTSFDAAADLISDLQALASGENVDVSVLNHADPLFLRRVVAEARLLYGSRTRMAELQLLAFKRYEDYRPYLAFERAYVARHTAGQPS